MIEEERIDFNTKLNVNELLDLPSSSDKTTTDTNMAEGQEEIIFMAIEYHPELIVELAAL